MTFVPSVAATTGATAAAAAAEMARKEEEEMTPYSREDLTEGWEFKILRSMTSAFKKPEKLRAFLEDESRAGWILVEKFDDTRIRLKRPADAKQRDGELDFDPYRTFVGISQGRYVITVLLLSLGIPLLIALYFVLRSSF
jgi:hypothetical protein